MFITSSVRCAFSNFALVNNEILTLSLNISSVLYISGTGS
jgi:hypothetical protein